MLCSSASSRRSTSCESIAAPAACTSTGTTRSSRANAAAGQQGIEETPWATGHAAGFEHEHRRARGAGLGHHVHRVGRADDAVCPGQQAGVGVGAVAVVAPGQAGVAAVAIVQRVAYFGRRARSEEHTSELQSLMRISYAVFRLEKKKN